MEFQPAAGLSDYPKVVLFARPLPSSAAPPASVRRSGMSLARAERRSGTKAVAVASSSPLPSFSPLLAALKTFDFGGGKNPENTKRRRSRRLTRASNKTETDEREGKVFYRVVTRPTFWTPFVPFREAAKLAEAEGMIIKRDITVTTPPRHGAVGRGRPIHPFGRGRRPWGAPPKQILVEVKLSKTIARPYVALVRVSIGRTGFGRPRFVRPASEAIAPLIQQRERREASHRFAPLLATATRRGV